MDYFMSVLREPTVFNTKSTTFYPGSKIIIGQLPTLFSGFVPLTLMICTRQSVTSGEGQFFRKRAYPEGDGFQFHSSAPYLQLYIKKGSSLLRLQSVDTPFYFNAWRQIALTLDGSGTADGAKMYSQGELLDVNVLQDDLSGSVENTVPLTIGEGLGVSDLSKNKLAQAFVYAGELTGPQIAAHISGSTLVDPRTLPTKTSLAHMWALGDTAKIKDLIGTANGIVADTGSVFRTNDHPFLT
jgi:hypothetical protein